jgi:hypothetical protein
MAHHCHAYDCTRGCLPAWLTCKPHWKMVPADLQQEVYRTVALRGKYVDATWAPRWRAQAKALAAIYRQELGARTDLTPEDLAGERAWIDRKLAEELKFANELEEKT